MKNALLYRLYVLLSFVYMVIFAIPIIIFAILTLVASIINELSEMLGGFLLHGGTYLQRISTKYRYLVAQEKVKKGANP
tara:strand:+ start:683 stop:919 length:237 start_codon:yes stop_codon:yes gene_type:complete